MPTTIKTISSLYIGPIDTVDIELVVASANISTVDLLEMGWPDLSLLYANLSIFMVA